MSNLSCIGFHCENDDDLHDLAMQAYQKAHPIAVGKNFYMQYADPSGAELWLQFDHQKKLIGLNPHFDAAQSWKVSLSTAIDDPENLMDGSFFGEAFRGDNDHTGLFPIIFDTPDFARARKMSIPATEDVWLAAFCRSVTVIKKESDMLPISRFYPSALYKKDGEVNPFPKSYFDLAAQVISAEILTNHLTAQSFYAITVDIQSHPLILLADPSMLPVEDVVPGATIKGEIWLSGRLKNNDFPREKKPWWKKIFKLSSQGD